MKLIDYFIAEYDEDGEELDHGERVTRDAMSLVLFVWTPLTVIFLGAAHFVDYKYPELNEAFRDKLFELYGFSESYKNQDNETQRTFDQLKDQKITGPN